MFIALFTFISILTFLVDMADLDVYNAFSYVSQHFLYLQNLHVRVRVLFYISEPSSHIYRRNHQVKDTCWNHNPGAICLNYSPESHLKAIVIIANVIIPIS